MGGSTYDYGLRETTYLDKIKSPRTTHEGGADIKYGRFLDELGWEFNQEGRRRQDLIRFGVWTTKSWLSHSATKDINKNLYPIPRAEYLFGIFCHVRFRTVFFFNVYLK